MAETAQHSCHHNAVGQKLVTGVMIPCRQCGALIAPSVNGGTGAGSVAATYPGNNDAAHKTFVFTH